MQQLLTGRQRLPGFDKHWKEVHLRDIFNPVRRKNDKGVTHVLTASGELGLVDQTEYFNRSVAGESLDGYFLLRRGEFAYNRSSMNGYPYGAIKRLDEYGEGVLSTLYICFKPASESCHSDFYKHLFEAGVLNRQLREVVQVGARAHGLLNVTVHDFFSLKVPCPPIEEQRRIAAIVDIANRELGLLRSQLDALREQKKGLMQQLLTGKIRVKV
jgi:type I restriction enzyme S subunit